MNNYINKEQLVEDLKQLNEAETEAKMEEVMGGMMIALSVQQDTPEACYKIANLFAIMGGMLEVLEKEGN